MIGSTPCPLCGSQCSANFHRDARREYLRCDVCGLVFVPSAYHLGRERELAEYDLHRNEVDDPGYRKFLSRLADPLRQRLSRGACGLDFGCGPAPALAVMLRESGFEVRLYDSFYHPEEAALAQRYDFICASEVVEHLHQPGAELDRLWSLLCPGGWLGVMTKLVIDRDAFARWHYKNDPTHVCFFSTDTWRWWANDKKTNAEFSGPDVVLLRKP